MTREWYSQVRQVLASARPAAEALASADSAGPEPRQLLRFHVQGPSAALRRAQIAEIQRIARWYGWHDEITAALAAAGVDALRTLPAHALDALAARMAQLEDCVQTGLGPPDAPPAR